ncbi:MAG: TAXI family TRAP transporter solute-binding subunit [Planctomycetales bacterium]|nr:TAXI family TRAP transporter solute-binding subunit [Planctomycetales bacterium]
MSRNSSWAISHTIVLEFQSALPEENQSELQVEAALAEYMRRCDAGDLPDRESFLSRHPELREQLTELLDAADWIESMAGPTAADEESGVVLQSVDRLTLLAGETEETLVHTPTFARDAAKQAAGADERRTELSQPLLPCQFGDYVLERVLGRGGMGVVYFGHQTHLERPVAIKMIRSGALASEEEVARFYTEARSAAKLDHPNIVTVHQCGEQDGHHYFSMDYVPGLDLSRMVEAGPLNGKVAARYVRDAARAIQYAHARGIVHRDLKPANVLVDDQDHVRITDFGLAKSMEHESGLTATGAALGTPSYMSPEQAAGSVDQQHCSSDIYSLGAVLFTIVTGRPPFKASSVVQTIMQVIHRPAPRARTFNAALDEDIETIIDVCLQKSPDQRYPSAGALADDLERYLVGAPIQARPMSSFRRAWYWLLGVPILGAVLDHRVVEPTDAHRWVQRGMISVGVMVIAAWLLLLIPSSVWYKNRMPSLVRVAAGVEGGGYHQLATTICDVLEKHYDCKAEVVVSAGSTDNMHRLHRGEVDLALLQADAVDSASVAVVTPLYFEVVHVLIRQGVDIANIGQLAGRRVLVGSEKTGSNRIARILLQHAGLTFDDIDADVGDGSSLVREHTVDAAIVVSRLGSATVRDALLSGHYRLLGIPNAWQFALNEPSFHVHPVEQQNYPDCGLPVEGIVTVATTAFLAAKHDTPSALVTAVLNQLFTPEMVASCGILSADQVAHWPELAWHPASREFFSPYRGSTPAFSK